MPSINRPLQEALLIVLSTASLVSRRNQGTSRARPLKIKTCCKDIGFYLQNRGGWALYTSALLHSCTPALLHANPSAHKCTDPFFGSQPEAYEPEEKKKTTTVIFVFTRPVHPPPIARAASPCSSPPTAARRHRSRSRWRW